VRPKISEGVGSDPSAITSNRDTEEQDGRVSFDWYPTIHENALVWPEGISSALQGDTTNVQSETEAAADVINNNTGLGGDRAPEINGGKLYLNQLMSQLCRLAGGYDIFIDCSGLTAEVGGEGDKPETPVGRLAIMATKPGTLQIESDDIELTAASSSAWESGPRVVNGVLRKDWSNSFPSVLVNAAPVLMEARVEFDPDDPMSVLAAGWDREYPGQGTGASNGDQTGGEEYQFLDYISTKCASEIQKTNKAFHQACSYWRKVFSAYHLNSALIKDELYAGTRYADLHPDCVPPPILQFLLSVMAEVTTTSNGTERRRLPFPTLVEVYYGNQWLVSDALSELEVDTQGNFYLDALRERSLGNALPYYGTFRSVATLYSDPMKIRANKLRLTIAFPLDVKLFEYLQAGGNADTNNVGDKWNLKDGFERMYLSNVGDAFREYLRKNAYPVPETTARLGGTGAPIFGNDGDGLNDFKPGEEYYSDRAAPTYSAEGKPGNPVNRIKEFAKRRMADVSRVFNPSEIVFDQIVMYKPGQRVKAIVDAAGNRTELNCVIWSVTHDCLANLTRIVLK